MTDTSRLAAAIADRFGLIAGQPRDHDQLVLELFEALQRERQVEVGAHTSGQPFVINDAVRVIDDAKAFHGSSRLGRRKGRNHGVQQREGDCCPHTAEECAA